ncbi:heme NO-binding domain-containing protein [Haloarchaeobius sp. HRN-SO-5]|uniref:heme NO-binding domain-containing protein n=1 Tax=Haloarchaeobius sp. HRN-SO-5 TaxID=3446118 RepID=UPI003EBE3B2F
MHGIILKGLKDFVVDTYDQQTWNQICEAADIERRLYVPVTEYPDEHVFALVEAAVDLSGEEPADLLRAFGRFVVPQLVQTYGVHVDEDWTGLDLIENVERYIHQALRSKNISTFDPPGIDARRIDAGTVVVDYDSDRQLCDVAMGLVQGIGEHYDESLDVEERQCMHDGAPSCKFVVTGATEEVDAITSQRARVDGGDTPTHEQ